MNERIYLDHAASTPLGEPARSAMLEVFDLVGNPSSAHEEGRRLKDHLESARNRIARSLGCRAREVLFLPSGTAASQVALLGAARARRSASDRVVIGGVEHPAVSEAAETLEREGWSVVTVPPGSHGNVDADAFLEHVGTSAALAALTCVHHETGVLQPVADVAAVLRTRGIPFLTDACLAVGRMPARPADLGADLVVYSAHKFGGPRGVGLLHVRRRTAVERLWTGGLQEERLVPGTENVAGAVGCAAALTAAIEDTSERARRYTALAERFLEALEAARPWSLVGQAPRVPGILTLEVPGVEGEAAMVNLDLEGVAAASGSTCAQGASLPSKGLQRLGLSRQRAASTIRVSIGEGNDEAQIDEAARVSTRIITRLRSLANR